MWHNAVHRRNTTPDKVLADQGRIADRQALRTRACIGIPLSTVVDEEEFVLLYPCSRPVDESLADVAVLAMGASEQVFQPRADADMDIENEIEAVLTGRMSKRRLDENDATEYPFLIIHSISKLRERVRPGTGAGE